MKSLKVLRLLAFVVAFIMVTAVCVACKVTPGQEEETTASTLPQNDPPAPTEPTNTDIVRELYKNVDYGGRDFRILGYCPDDHWYHFVCNGFNEIWFETDSGDALSSAVYTRNRRAEDLIHINIVPTYPSSSTSEVIGAMLSANDDFLDTFAISIAETYNESGRAGRLVNFYNMEKIDLTRSWWDQFTNNGLTLFGNKLYAATGDALVWDDYSISLFIFNSDMIETYGLTNPYDLVRAGTWTFDRFNELSHVVTSDLNNDGHMDEDDRWGSSCYYGALFHLTYACDITLTKNDYLGTPMLNIDSEEMIDRVSYIFNDVMHSGDMMLSGTTPGAIEMLANGNLLFYHTQVSHIGLLRGYDFHYGLIPMPKYDEAQTRYTTPVDTIKGTAYSVPNTVKDLDFVGDCLEVLSGFSTDTVNEAIFTTLLGDDSQLIRDDDSAEMLRIIFNGKVIDWSDFDTGGINDLFRQLSNSSSFTYVSQVDIQYDALEFLLDEWVAAFEALD